MPTYPRRSPVLIRIMLACYYSPCPEEEVGHNLWHSPAGRDAREWLRGQGLVNPFWRATERGKAWVQFICDTPLPEHRTRVIEEWFLPASRGNFASSKGQFNPPDGASPQK